eukprot:516598-Amphidinium_carterae.2
MTTLVMGAMLCHVHSRSSIPFHFPLSFDFMYVPRIESSLGGGSVRDCHQYKELDTLTTV